MNKRIRIVDNHMSIACDFLLYDKDSKTIDVYSNYKYITSLDLKIAKLKYISQCARTKFYKIVDK